MMDNKKILVSFIFLSTLFASCLTNTERGPGFREQDKKDVMDEEKDLSLDSKSHLDLRQGEDSSLAIEVPASVIATVTMIDIKTLEFKWLAVEGVEDYKILEDKDATGDFVEIFTLSKEIQQKKYSISLYQNRRSIYKVQSCNRAGCSDSAPMKIEDMINDGIGYFKAHNADKRDFFGGSIAINGDGSVIVVGAKWEKSEARGIDGDSSNNSLNKAGAAYVFQKINGQWKQKAYLKASNTGLKDEFGGSVSISADGKTIAVGARAESSAGIGVNGNGQDDDSAPAAGAAYVFVNTNDKWSQIAYIKASNSQTLDTFGHQVILSADGQTLAVSAPNEASNSTTINEGENDNSVADNGALYVFRRAGNTWTQEAYLKTNETMPMASMGVALAVSGDGNLLATNYGTAVFIFERSGEEWTQKAKILPNVFDGSDFFGETIALSGDGSFLLVGASFEDGSGRGVNKDANNNSTQNSGAAYIFRHEQENWIQDAYIKSSNSDLGDFFGQALSINAAGNIIAISSIGEKSKATGINGNQDDESFSFAGAVYVFERKGTQWRQISYLKAPNTEEHSFGLQVALSGDGKSLGASALNWSAARGIGGDPTDTSAKVSGAFFLY